MNAECKPKRKRKTPEEEAERKVQARIESLNRRSLCQARLDRIAHPTNEWYRSYLKWFAKISTRPALYPAAEMKRHLQDELGPEIAKLKELVFNPPSSTLPVDWDRAEDRLQRLEGKAKAIEALLEIRTRQAERMRMKTETSALPPRVGPGSAAEPGNSQPKEVPVNRDPFSQE